MRRWRNCKFQRRSSEIDINCYDLVVLFCIITWYFREINDQWLILKSWLQFTHCARLWPNMWAGQCAVCTGWKTAPGTKWDQLLCITTFDNRSFCWIHFGMLIWKMLTSLPCHLESKQVTKGVSSTRFAFAACQARVASDQCIIAIFLGNYAYISYFHVHNTESSAVDCQPVLFPWSLLLPWQGDGSAVAWGSPFAGGDTSEAFGGGHLDCPRVHDVQSQLLHAFAWRFSLCSCFFFKGRTVRDSRYWIWKGSRALGWRCAGEPTMV